MKTNQNTFIAMLLITAVLLGTLVVGSWQSQRVEAATVDHTATGDYIMATGNISASTSLLYVIDVPNQKLLVYATDGPRNTVTVVDDRIDLGRIFATAR